MIAIAALLISEIFENEHSEDCEVTSFRSGRIFND